ncbi:MAG: hypothetical protein Ct9H90mP25_5860 [Gammaproteobacteria bacterium]|nr:MAG: hypothetical protein Ct9H90mP25_5860 [Gammaproteobacteria bacterium]
MPPSTIPGEGPTLRNQFRQNPPPFEQIGVTEDDLIDFTPELREEALEISKNLS